MDLELDDGRTVRVHDSGRGSPAVVWHHGTPQTGALLEPVVAAADARGLRVVSYGRPSYGGSSPHRGRSVRSAGADVAQIADALGIERFAAVGASGGGPHALACAATLPGRVTGVVTLGGIAPYTDAFEWFAGMVDPSALRAAREGREARERLPDHFDTNVFTAADWSALEARWESMGRDAGAAGSAGTEGMVDDDLAFAAPWGFDLQDVDVPVLVVQGGEDRVIPPSHAEWLVRNLPHAELWLRPRDGHVSVLDAVPVALDWLRAHR